MQRLYGIAIALNAVAVGFNSALLLSGILNYPGIISACIGANSIMLMVLLILAPDRVSQAN